MAEETLKKPLSIITSSNSDFKLIDEGVYDSDITKVEERTQFNKFSNTEETGIQIEFTIISEGAMKGNKAYNFFNPFLTANSNLTKCTKAVMGRDFTPEELASIKELSDLARFLLKKPCQIIVKNRTSARGNKYYTISDYVKSPRIGGQEEVVEGEPVDDDEAAQVFANDPNAKGEEELSEEEIAAIAANIEGDAAPSVPKATPRNSA